MTRCRGREGQAAHPREPGQCLHFECRGAPGLLPVSAKVRSPGVETACERVARSPPLLPHPQVVPHHFIHYFVCVWRNLPLTLPYLRGSPPLAQPLCVCGVRYLYRTWLGSQTLLLTRKYVLWRFALVYERLRCEPWRPWGWGETTRRPRKKARAHRQAGDIAALSIETGHEMSALHPARDEQPAL